MSRFGKPPADGIEREAKTGKVTGIKSSPEKGCRRIIMSEKSVTRKSFAVDVPYKEAKDIERKGTYTAKVYEKRREDEYGGMQSRSSSGKMKTYMCDEAPTPYEGGRKSQFGSPSDDDSGSSSRLKF